MVSRVLISVDLSDAVKLEQTDAVRAILSAGANVNVTDSLGECLSKLFILKTMVKYCHKSKQCRNKSYITYLLMVECCLK